MYSLSKWFEWFGKSNIQQLDGSSYRLYQLLVLSSWKQEEDVQSGKMATPDGCEHYVRSCLMKVS